VSSRALHAAAFEDPETAQHLSDAARVQAMLDCEVALAEAQAALGIVPQSCLAALRRAARAEEHDLASLGRQATEAGNLAIPLVRSLTQRVAALDPDAARYVHWGATSQDIVDSALALQLRKIGPVILRHLRRCGDAAAGHARTHVDAIMPGRTWLQHAAPITFGLKAAGWLDALARVRVRVAEAFAACAVLQLGGATGTLAALGPRALEVAEAMAARLGLAVPDLPWHAHRDRVADLAGALGVATGTLGKIAHDLALLAQTEVGEVLEAAREGRGGSSTLPHKRNPVAASSIATAALRAPGLVATLLHALPQEHERGIAGWQAEWETLPDLLALGAGAARTLAEALEGLEVRTDRMRENLGATHGMIHAEALAMRLAERIGKAEAHARVEAACRKALRDGTELLEVLRQDPETRLALDPAELERTLAAGPDVGMARTLVERALARWKTSGDAHG
jgi:3-carboxy-cis,cis-muconate cycloisomerase